MATSAQPVAEPAASPLVPREELFRRAVARDDVQVPIGVLIAEHEAREEAGVEGPYAEEDVETETTGAAPVHSVTKQDNGRVFPSPAAGTEAAAGPRPAELSVTNHDTGRVFSSPAEAHPAARPRLAERSVTDHGTGRVFSPPWSVPVPPPVHARRNIP